MEVRCKETLEYLLRSDVNHSVVTQESFRAKVEKKGTHYALLPVWMLHTRWQDQDFLFAMNGQTGKLVGDLPCDKKKLNRITLLSGLGTFAVVFGIAAAMLLM